MVVDSWSLTRLCGRWSVKCGRWFWLCGRWLVVADSWWLIRRAGLWFGVFFPVLAKSVPCPSVFNILRWKLQSCALFVDRLSQIEARTRGNRDPTSFSDPRTHITRKNRGFRAWDFFYPWIHMLPNCYTSQLLDDGWLASWCGWHDGGSANHDNRP